MVQDDLAELDATSISTNRIDLDRHILDAETFEEAHGKFYDFGIGIG